jgi:hypothetical protein
MTNESLDIRVAIGEANLDELEEYAALIAKEIKRQRSQIRKSQFGSFVRTCEKFLNNLSDEDRGQLLELSNEYCDNCYERQSHYETIEYTLTALIEYFKKAE